jgi:RHS repeat-associated protein
MLGTDMRFELVVALLSEVRLHLGTSRVITTNAGVVCYDADFYPFGGERSYTNACSQNYKFEGKERDTETGNDDFGARYYSNRFGRWLSADWSSVPVPVPYANLTNPQTLNLYAMVVDDPESFADLDGHFLNHGMNTCVGEGSIGCSPLENEQMEAAAAVAPEQQATQAQPVQQQNEGGPISLTLGGTRVTGEYSFGWTGGTGPEPDALPMRGAVVDANADCTNCFWTQTISNTGDTGTFPHKQTTDNGGDKNSPILLGPSPGYYHDTPSREKGHAGASTLVAILGTADPKKQTFSAKGAITYGYSVDKQGNVTGSAPRLATKKELRQALAVVRREFPGWKIN